MATVSLKLYQPLLAAKVPEQQAMEAAEEATSSAVMGELQDLKTEMRVEFAGVKERSGRCGGWSARSASAFCS